MSTTLYLRVTPAPTNKAGYARGQGGIDNALDGSVSGWKTYLFAAVRGAGASTLTVASIAGPTNGIEVDVTAPVRVEWVSPGLTSDVTISGTITLNLWEWEGAVGCNAAVNAIIERIGPTGAVISTIAQTSRTTEAPTAAAAANFTVTPTSTNLVKGDHIRVRVYWDDATPDTMAAAGNLNISVSGDVPTAQGDSYITFTEDFTTHYSEDPGGTTLYLTDTAGPAVGSATEREMWTSRGGGVQTDVVNTVDGWTSPIQWTDTAGGAVVEWYSKPLLEFLLADSVIVAVRASESGVVSAGVRIELAICDGDGTNVVVWAAGNMYDSGEELTLAEEVRFVRLTGPDTPVSSGQRLRFRAYLDDADGVLVTGSTATLYYAGAADATGDSYLLLSQQVVESTASTVNIYPDADTTTTGWTSTPLWSKVDESPLSPDGTTITATSS